MKIFTSTLVMMGMMLIFTTTKLQARSMVNTVPNATETEVVEMAHQSFVFLKPINEQSMESLQILSNGPCIDCANLAFISFQNWYLHGDSANFALNQARMDWDHCMELHEHCGGSSWPDVEKRCQLFADSHPH